MKIRMEIAGGIVAPLMAKQYSLDSARLPEAKKEELQNLVAAALAEPAAAANPRLRDARSYELEIDCPEGKQTIVAYDGSVKPATRQLIKLIQTLAAT